MCVLSIKVLIRKKSGNLFNDPRTSYSWSPRTRKIDLVNLISLFGLVSWHINHCRLFNAKSISYIKQFQTIQFSISTQFKFQNSSISNNSVKHQHTV